MDNSAEANGPSPKTSRPVFRNKDDISLLKEALAHEFEDYTGIGEELTVLMGRSISKRTVRERLIRLIERFRAEDTAALSRSGTEEEIDEKLLLLQDVSDMYKNGEAEREERAGTKKKNQLEKRRQGEALREAAMARQTGAEVNNDVERESAKKRPRVNAASFLEAVVSKKDTEAELRREEMGLRREELAIRRQELEVQKEERKLMFELLAKAISK